MTHSCFLAVALLASLGAAGPASADKPALSVETQLEFLDALRTRKLAGLSEALAERLLQSPALSVNVRSETVLEMAAALSARGNKALDAEQRRRLWGRADRLVAEFFEQHAGYPRMPLFRYRWAGVLLSRSSMAWELTKILPEDELLRADAAAAADEMQRQMDLVRAELKTVLAQDAAARTTNEGLSFDDMASLSSAAEFRTGVSWLAVARTKSDPNSINHAVAKAEQYLKGFVSALSNHAIVMESHLALAEVYELADRGVQAVSLLQRFDQIADLPQEFVSRAHLQLSGLLLKENRVDEALRILEAPTDQRVPGAEWEIRRFEALLRKAAGVRDADPGLAQRLQTQSLEILDQLEELYGRYWGRRGEKALSQYGNLTGDNLQVLKRLANVQRNDGQIEQALQSYQRAAHLARLQKETDLAAEMQFAAGSVLFDLGRNVESAETLTELVRENRFHRLSPNAAVTAAYALGRQWNKDKTPQAETRYREAIDALLTWFPDSEHAAEAHWLLGELEEASQNLDKAMDHYVAVPPTHKRFPAALSSTAAIYHDNLLSAAKPDQRQVLAGRNNLGRMLSGLESGEEAESAKRAAATARFVLAGLLAREPDPDYENARGLLESLLEEGSGLAQGLRGRAWAELLHTLWKQGDAEECRQYVGQTQQGTEKDLIRVLASLDPMADSLTQPQRAAQIALIQSAGEWLFANMDAVSTSDRINIRLLLARCHVAQQNFKQADELLQRLRAEAPRDPRVIELLAVNAYRNKDFGLSERYWALLQRGLRRGSPEWLNAVYHLIACAHAQKEDDRARKLLAATEALYPELGGEELRGRFTTLKAELNQP